MRTPYLLSTLLFLLTYALPAQIAEVLRPVDFLTQFNDVYVDDTGNGWAVGSCNTLVQTTDDGLSWDVIPSPLAGELSSVACPPSGCATAVIITSQTSEIARSTDSGANWVISQAEPGEWFPVERLDFVSEDIVIGNVGSSYLLRSEDGGANWVKIEFDDFVNASIEFPGGLLAYYFDGSSNLRTSTDGGLNWTNTGYVHPVNVRYLTFVNENIGFLRDSDQELFKTTDGGLSWTFVSDEGLPFNLTLLVALSETELRGVQVSDRVYESSDGGLTWTSYAIDLGDGTFVKRNFHKRGEEYFLVSNLSEIYYSAAEFRNWESLVQADRNDITSLLFTDDQTGYLSEESGGLLKTTDAGDSWTMIQTLPIRSKLFELPTGELMRVSNTAHPEVSTDGGMTFTAYLPTSVTDQLNTTLINFSELPGGRLYFSSGIDGVYSDDGGASWTVLDFQDFPVAPVNDLYFFDNNLGFMASSGGGRIARTTDGGLNWEDLTDVSPTSQPLSKFYFSDVNNGIVFNAARAYRTTDGGDSWAVDNSLPGSSDYEIDNNGQILTAAFASGNNGSAHRSVDGGENWAEFGYTCAAYRATAITPDGRYFFAGGDGGNLVRFDLDLVNPTRESNPTQKFITLFPNPAKDVFTIKLNEVNANTKLMVSMTDLLGRQVQQARIRSAAPLVDISVADLPAGIYLVIVGDQAGTWSQTQRLVVE